MLNTEEIGGFMKPKNESGHPGGSGTSRRSFLKGMGIVAGAAAVLPGVGESRARAQSEEESSPDVDFTGSGERQITLKINGAPMSVTVEPRTTLLDALREKLHITGAKEVCDRGSCGCCSVLLDGKAITSCMMLAVDAVDREIMTVEGIAEDPRYENLVEAFCEYDGAQCGYCIPGFVVRSAELLAEIPNPSRDEIREGLAGNICRCGTYTKIFESVSGAVTKGGLK